MFLDRNDDIHNPTDMFDEVDNGMIASIVIAGISVFLIFASLVSKYVLIVNLLLLYYYYILL